MSHSIHVLLVAALLVPFAALSLAVILLSFGIAWLQRTSRKGR